MKLLSFETGGVPRFGSVRGDRIVDLTGRIGGARTLAELIANDAMEEARTFAEASVDDLDLASVTLLPVIPNPGKIICLGLNYRGHAEEVGKPLPAHPVVFHRHAQTLVADRAPILRPLVSTHFDYEGELAVVMGKRGGHIRPEDALDHVAGYTIFNEASVRDWQKHSHLYGMGKNFRSTGAVGPWMVTRDEIPDPRALHLQPFLNDDEVQSTSIDDLVFAIPELIAYVSKAIDWMPGDLLVTGTPSGVGLFRNPQRFLRAGDVVEVRISQIGSLFNPVEDEVAPPGFVA